MSEKQYICDSCMNALTDTLPECIFDEDGDLIDDNELIELFMNMATDLPDHICDHIEAPKDVIKCDCPAHK